MNFSIIGVHFYWISALFFGNRSGYEIYFEGKLILLLTRGCSFSVGEQHFAPFTQTV